MGTVQLNDIAFARSGDKGDIANIGLLAKDERCYAVIARELTPERVKAHFGPMVTGKVEIFPMPNILAFNLLLHGGLGGGATRTLRWDQTGKSMGQALLRLKLPDGAA
jgi:hypothetical protein